MLTLFALVSYAQQWELGGAAGYGLYRNGSVYAPAGKVTAGVRNRFAVGAVFTENMYEHVSGEIRYLHQDGDPFVSSGGTQSNVQGQSHAFHYDLLIAPSSRASRFRAFAAIGAGVKRFVVTGPAPMRQAFPNIVSLTSNDETKPLVTAGGGVKYRLTDRMLLRFDFRDYITPFPKKLIAPAAFGTARGILQQFTPMGGIGLTF